MEMSKRGRDYGGDAVVSMGCRVRDLRSMCPLGSACVRSIMGPRREYVMAHFSDGSTFSP